MPEAWSEQRGPSWEPITTRELLEEVARLRAANLLPTLTLPNLQLASKGRPKKVANAEDTERARGFLEDIKKGINEAEAQVSQVLQGGTGNNPGGKGTRRIRTHAYLSSHVTRHATVAHLLPPCFHPAGRRASRAGLQGEVSCLIGATNVPSRTRIRSQSTRRRRHAPGHTHAQGTTHYAVLTNHAIPYYATPVPSRRRHQGRRLCQSRRRHPLPPRRRRHAPTRTHAHRLSAYTPIRLLQGTTHYALLTNEAIPYYATPVPSRTRMTIFRTRIRRQSTRRRRHAPTRTHAHRLSAYTPIRLLQGTTHYALLTNEAIPYYATPVPSRTRMTIFRTRIRRQSTRRRRHAPGRTHAHRQSAYIRIRLLQGTTHYALLTNEAIPYYATPVPSRTRMTIFRTRIRRQSTRRRRHTPGRTHAHRQSAYIRIRLLQGTTHYALLTNEAIPYYATPVPSRTPMTIFRTRIRRQSTRRRRHAPGRTHAHRQSAYIRIRLLQGTTHYALLTNEAIPYYATPVPSRTRMTIFRTRIRRQSTRRRRHAPTRTHAHRLAAYTPIRLLQGTTHYALLTNEAIPYYATPVPSRTRMTIFRTRIRRQSTRRRRHAPTRTHAHRMHAHRR